MTNTSTPLSRELRALCRLYGVHTSYRDVTGHIHTACPEIAISVLHTLGAPVASPADIHDALTLRRETLAARVIDPCLVVIAQDNTITLGKAAQGKAYSLRIFSESSTCKESSTCGESSTDKESGQLVCEKNGVATDHTENIALSSPLQPGYYLAELEIDNQVHRSHILCTPGGCYQGQGKSESSTCEELQWGIFCPLYALHCSRSQRLGGPDYTSLQEVAEWMIARGGRVLSTLPLYAQWTGPNSDPSPYRPISRLMWNEQYLDLEQLATQHPQSQVQELLDSRDFISESQRMSEGTTIEYAQLAAHRSNVLRKLSSAAWTDPPTKQKLEAFIANNKRIDEYAHFRAKAAAHGEHWQTWPKTAPERRAPEWQYHCYVQWQCRKQLAQLQDRCKQRGADLYLDVPVGVHPNGFDAWRFRPELTGEASAGAPPDAYFVSGQNWATPVIVPEQSARTGHAYFRQVLGEAFRFAGIARIDHVMAMHRLFWIPTGADATQGVYVHYPAKQLYAVLAIESHYNQCVVVGEDLGTVPDHIRQQLCDQGARRMYIGQYDLVSQPDLCHRSAMTDTVASLNTHDMPLFAGFLSGSDIRENQRRGALTESQAEAATSTRIAHVRALASRLGDDNITNLDLLAWCLSQMAAADAWMLLVSLEDLWLEERPQNVPGTSGPSWQNWCRRFRWSMEHWKHDQRVNALLSQLHDAHSHKNS